MKKINVYVNEDEFSEDEKIPSPEDVRKLVDDYVDDDTDLIDIRYLKTVLAT